jgi:hypothetical protein
VARSGSSRLRYLVPSPVRCRPREPMPSTRCGRGFDGSQSFGLVRRMRQPGSIDLDLVAADSSGTARVAHTGPGGQAAHRTPSLMRSAVDPLLRNSPIASPPTSSFGHRSRRKRTTSVTSISEPRDPISTSALRPEAVAPAKFVYDPKPRCPAMRRIGVLISFRKSDHEAGSLVAEFREEDCRDARLVDLPER